MDTTRTVIPLDRPDRLLKKAEAYIFDMERFLSDVPGAVTVLLAALPHADAAGIMKMIPLIGYGGRDRALMPLYRLMMENADDDAIRTATAVQLGAAASLSDDPADIRARLIADLDHPDARIRCACALALGWDGNTVVADRLLDQLSDTDRDVQTAVVTALASLGDPRLFDRLTDCMPFAPYEVRRSILLNLWRFEDQTPPVEKWYLETLPGIEAALRPDLLTGLAMLSLSPAILDLYRNLLDDHDPQIRRQVMENLMTREAAVYRSLMPLFRRRAKDPDPRVRQAAIRLLFER